MLTLKDCIALSELTDEEVAAIGEHEHLPMIVAAEYGNYLMGTLGGVPQIKRIIAEDIAAAKNRGDQRHALALKLVLRHFVATHPSQVKPCQTGHPQHDRIIEEFLAKLPPSGRSLPTAAAK